MLQAFNSGLRQATARHLPANRPVVTCIAGGPADPSTTRSLATALMLAGKIPLAPESDEPARPRDPGVQADLEELRLRRVELADEVLVVNPGGPVPRAAAAEVVHALDTGTPLFFVEPYELTDQDVVRLRFYARRRREILTTLAERRAEEPVDSAPGSLRLVSGQ